MEIMDDLVSHMNALGYRIDRGSVALDGKIHRFDHQGKKDGWLVGFLNNTIKGDRQYIVANFGSWKTGDKEEFKTAMQYSREDKKAITADIEKAKKKLEVARAMLQEEAAQDAESLFEHSIEKPISDYLSRKKIDGLYGARTNMGHSGREIIVPMRDVDGKMWGAQRILPDGTKLYMAGQRKESCFHVVPYLKGNLENEETIYLAEGFATAVAIHRAIGKPVVVAFDSGNLMSVAKALKSKYSDKAMVICGDEDKFTKDKDGLPINAGRKCAEETAKAVLAKTVFPRFEHEETKPTDFDDLFALEGLEAVRNLILDVKPEFHAVHALGYQDDLYYFISSDKPRVMSISRSGFSKQTLMDLMPLEYWETNFPSKQGVAWDLAINSLMKGCRSIGYFDRQIVRGSGVWKDQGKTVVNLGRGLWVDGELLEFREMKSKFIYQESSKGVMPKRKFASCDEMIALDAELSRLSWKKSEYAKLLLGWLMVAPITGTLKWRPHLWITGPSGSGKTFVMTDIIDRLIGDLSTRVEGSTTEAGVRQTIGDDAKPIIFDELETDDQRSSERVTNVIELCRQASSETSGQVVKGSAGGRAVAYTVRFSAIVSSIRPNLTREQDRNRFAVLELERDENNEFTGDGGIQANLRKIITADFSEKMFSRSVHKVDLVSKNRDVFYDVLHEKYNGRFADQYGTLLAGYFAAVDDTPVSRDLAIWAVDEFIKLDDQADETSSHDERDCLNHLLASTVRHGDGTTVTIGELIERHQSLKEPSLIKGDANQDTLMRYGVKVISQNVIAVQYSNPELAKIYRGQKWMGGWAAVLRRLEGAESGKNFMFHGVQKKCVKIKLEEAVV